MVECRTCCHRAGRVPRCGDRFPFQPTAGRKSSTQGCQARRRKPSASSGSPCSKEWFAHGRRRADVQERGLVRTICLSEGRSSFSTGLTSSGASRPRARVQRGGRRLDFPFQECCPLHCSFQGRYGGGAPTVVHAGG
ncbi:unnamed protein product [Symbiodinium pilosum]|uniref:Uncharacterized protein n=1 Tax=Symbiodinium pilosum TaxID=2952 RepID=A0A812M004_SYMPI|nr:unnamed protein product [Symbiodinium pilosum]